MSQGNAIHNDSNSIHKPIVVLIRDGWGYRKEHEFNATTEGNVSFTKKIMQEYPNVNINAAGESVGLPDGYQGNSEVGHMAIGSGRIIYQSMVRINKAIQTGEFHKNPAFLKAIENCKKNNTTLHIMGLLQEEGVHAHIDHCCALLDTCKQQNFTKVVIHVFSDGRDAPPKNTITCVKKLLEKFKRVGFGSIATITGRYYAMDRDNRWDRTRKAYDCVVLAKGEGTFTDPVQCFESCYATEETDEFIKPRVHVNYKGIQPKDSVIFYNFRTDRPRQITKAMIEDSFEGWERKPLDITYVGMTDYYNPISARASIAFTPQSLKNLLGEVLSAHGKKQLRISETEKYAHVTFFFNGQIEEPFKGEDHVLIPSPKVATYDLAPEMSVHQIGDRLVQEIDKNIYDVIVTNFVNGDMVGHTGDWDAILTAVHAVDQNVEKVVKKVLEKNGVVLVFADHGNCEDKTEEFRTSHTKNPVPFIVISNDPALKNIQLKTGKGLQDIAPTVLKLLNIPKPAEMTGESII